MILIVECGEVLVIVDRVVVIVVIGAVPALRGRAFRSIPDFSGDRLRAASKDGVAGTCQRLGDRPRERLKIGVGYSGEHILMRTCELVGDVAEPETRISCSRSVSDASDRLRDTCGIAASSSGDVPLHGGADLGRVAEIQYARTPDCFVRGYDRLAEPSDRSSQAAEIHGSRGDVHFLLSSCSGRIDRLSNLIEISDRRAGDDIVGSCDRSSDLFMEML